MTASVIIPADAHDKLRVSLRYWLLGRGYHLAAKAMEFGAKFHTGLRKNGDPEYSHQIWQVHYMRTLEPSLLFPEETFITIFLHDTLEDYREQVKLYDIIEIFGPKSGQSTELMSKIKEDGSKKTDEEYFGQLAGDPIASVAKGVDRIHNHKTMIDAFSPAKQIDYIGETDDGIMPMLKDARRRFPEQELVYENIKHSLVSQMELLKYAHQFSGALKA